MAQPSLRPQAQDVTATRDRSDGDEQFMIGSYMPSIDIVSADSQIEMT